MQKVELDMSASAQPSSPTLAQQLASRLVKMRSATLPDDVINRAKMCVLDQLGIQIRGANMPHVQAAATVAEALGGRPESSLPMTDARLPPAYAAFVAGTFGHSIEFDDSYMLCGHPGACVIPAALAVAEAHRASGRAVLTAIVAGYEAMVLGVGPIHLATIRVGWHGTKVGGVFGAAAATAALMDLDEPTTAHALAIAGSEASGTMEYDRTGGEVKRVHAGMAARSGVEAALLASAGLTGPLTIFEGIRGIYRLFGDGSGPEVDSVWSHPFHIRDVQFKLYPTMGAHHAPLDALRYLMENEAVTAEDVEWISVSTAPWVILHGGNTGEATDMISAQFNLGFSLAIRLLRNSNALSLYMDPAMWRDPDVLALSRLVRVQGMSLGPGDSELSTLVEIGLRNGRVVCRREAAPRGHHSNPASPTEVEDKFLDLVDGLLPPSRTRQIIDTVQRLDEVADITELTKLLRP